MLQFRSSAIGPYEPQGRSEYFAYDPDSRRILPGLRAKAGTDASRLPEARQQLAETAEEIEEKYPDLAQMVVEEGEEILGGFALTK